MEILLFWGFVIVLVMLLSLRSRVKRLEELLAGKAQPTVAPAPAISVGPEHQSLLEKAVVPSTPTAPLVVVPGAGEQFFAWLKEDWLIKLGAFLLLIGFGWLASYAFLNNWIGPMGRIALGLLAGVAILIVGWLRMRAYVAQGSVFLVLGSTIILLTTFAARELYGFFTPLTALLLMFLSSAFVAFSSVVHRRQQLALASILLAAVAPALTNSPSPDYIALFAYLFVVTLGTLWIVARTGWRALTGAALLMVFLYSMPHFSYSPFGYMVADKGALLLFAYAFVTLFFFVATLGILKLTREESTPDLVIAGGNGLFLIAWIMTAAADNWMSLIMAAWTLVFVAGAFLIFRATGRREPFYIYAGVGVMLLAAATAQELSSAALTIAYTIESGLIIATSYFFLRDVKLAERTSLLMIGPIMLSASSLVSSAWSRGVIHDDFFVLLLLAITLLTLGNFFYKFTASTAEKLSSGPVFAVIGSLYVYVLLWLSLHAAMPYAPDTATMIALLCYTIVGLVFYIGGKRNDKKALKIYGAALLLFVTGRLLLIDVWDMELTGRIFTFFLIGALFMSTAFIKPKKPVEIAPVV